MCDFCGERRTQKHSLENHIRVVHKKLPPKANLKCNFCEEVFKNPEAKRRHTGLVHFPEKHKCSICLRSCYSAFRLQLHMRTHSGRTFDCQGNPRPSVCKLLNRELVETSYKVLK